MALSSLPNDNRENDKDKENPDESWRKQLLPTLSFLLGVSKNTAIFFSIGIFGMFVGLFLVAGYLLLIAEPSTPTPFKQSLFKEVDNPMNISQTYELTINLHSQTFGAQDEITAYVELEPINDERQFYAAAGYLMPDQYRIWFDGTFCRESGNSYERIFPCYLDLTREPEQNSNWQNVHWQGNRNLTYSAGGVFGVAVSNGTSTIYQISDMGEPFVKIEGVEAKNSFDASQQSLRIGNRSLGLGFLGVATSLVVIYLSFLSILVITRKSSNKPKG